MNRRLLVQLAGLSLAPAAFAAPSGHEGHGPHAGHGRAAPPAGERHPQLIKAYQACTVALSTCIAHCQVLLAEGDKSLGDCLRTALDCDVTCGATLKAAALQSAHTAALARVAVASMKECVEACKPHVEHHAECKACHDACLAAIKASRRLGA